MNSDTIISLAEKKIKEEGPLLKDFRETHLALLKKKAFKEVELDSYKFTNLNTFFETLSLDSKNAPKNTNDFTASFPTLRFIDGKLDRAIDPPKGVTVKEIKEEFARFKDLFKESNSLSHFHHAYLTGGSVIEVEKNADIQEPIRILNILTNADVIAPAHIIVAKPFSRVTILEETRGTETSHVIVSETYIQAEESSNVTHIALDQEGSQGLNHASVFAEVAKDANVKSFIFHGSGKLNRKNLTLNLNAPGSNGESYSLFLTSGEEHSDINTKINHKAHDTTSNQIAKGILDGSSKGVFTGLIHIFPKAQRVQSGQLNKNLLLSKKAQVHSQPQLEIFADDVKCSHGSTTGQLSDDEVFYFQARGIPEDKARTLLALGFGLEVVQKIENKNARDYVSKVIMENLETKFSLKGTL